MKIRWGPAGIGSPPEEGLQRCHALGLDAAEVAFTYGVYMDNPTAQAMGRTARRLGIRLSVHAPYYINLASRDKTKRRASRRRILDSCERAHHMAARNVVFHAGFYEKRPPETVYGIIRDEIQHLQDVIAQKEWKVLLSPETTGKPTQFAGLEELVRLKRDTGCQICIDFAHLYARRQGRIDFDALLADLPRWPHLHAHFSGITFTGKGEKKHIPLTLRRFRPLARALIAHPPRSITLICEAPPDTFAQAAKMKMWFANNLRRITLHKKSV
jgi:deoxyribonuclease-4